MRMVGNATWWGIVLVALFVTAAGCYGNLFTTSVSKLGGIDIDYMRLDDERGILGNTLQSYMLDTVREVLTNPGSCCEESKQTDEMICVAETKEKQICRQIRKHEGKDVVVDVEYSFLPENVDQGLKTKAEEMVHGIAIAEAEGAKDAGKPGSVTKPKGGITGVVDTKQGRILEDERVWQIAAMSSRGIQKDENGIGLKVGLYITKSSIMVGSKRFDDGIVTMLQGLEIRDERTVKEAREIIKALPSIGLTSDDPKRTEMKAYSEKQCERFNQEMEGIHEKVKQGEHEEADEYVLARWKCNGTIVWYVESKGVVMDTRFRGPHGSILHEVLMFLREYGAYQIKVNHAPVFVGFRFYLGSPKLRTDGIFEYGVVNVQFGAWPCDVLV